MKKTNHLESWLTEAEAAELLRMSTRNLRRLSAEGTGPERQKRERPGVRPEPVYNPDDVARLAATKPVVFAPSSSLAPRPPETLPVLNALEQLASLLHSRMLSPPRPPARWLTLKQARETTGLSIALLKRLIAAGHLRVLRDGALKVLQADLDGLDNVEVLSGLARTEKAKAVGGGK